MMSIITMPSTQLRPYTRADQACYYPSNGGPTTARRPSGPQPPKPRIPDHPAARSPPGRDQGRYPPPGERVDPLERDRRRRHLPERRGIGPGSLPVRARTIGGGDQRLRHRQSAAQVRQLEASYHPMLPPAWATGRRWRGRRRSGRPRPMPRASASTGASPPPTPGSSSSDSIQHFTRDRPHPANTSGDT